MYRLVRGLLPAAVVSGLGLVLAGCLTAGPVVELTGVTKDRENIISEESASQRHEQWTRCVRQRVWTAYFLDRYGQIQPVRDRDTPGRDEDWLNLRFTDHEGPRLPLTVLSVINRSVESSEEGPVSARELWIAGLRELLIAALFRTKRFDIFEDPAMVRERWQTSGASGVVPDTPRNAPSSSPFESRFLVYGTVNEWIPDRSWTRALPLAALGFEVRVAEVAMTFFLTDAMSGQILLATEVRAKVVSWVRLFDRGKGERLWSQRTPVTDAAQICANKAAFRIAEFLKERKWQGEVSKVDGEDVFVNAGSRQGISLGYKFSVFARRGIVRELRDGPILGEDLKGVGTLTVIAVYESFSIARLVEGRKGIREGDRIELTAIPEGPPSFPNCHFEKAE